MSNEKLRTILVVTPYFPPMGGGLEKYAFEISRRLQNEGNNRIVVITSGARFGSDLTEEVDGMKIYRLSYFFKISNTPLGFFWCGKIYKILNKEKPDIVNIHTPVPGIGDMVSMLSKKIPLVVTYHTGSMHKGFFLPDLLVWLYEHWLMGKILQRASKIVCSSDYVRLNFLEKYQYKSVTITPAVDLNCFRPKAEEKAKIPTVLFVSGLGRAEQHKGLEMLIEVMLKVKEVVPGVQLVVAGEGDMRSEYEKKVKYLNLTNEISFVGRLESECLAKKYQAAHVFVQPSSNESFSMVVLEAMASGLPVVASRAGGIPLLVSDNESGYLVPVGDSNAFAKRITELLMNPLLAECFGLNGLKSVTDQFSWSARSKQYEEIFSQIFNNKIKRKISVLETPIRYYPYIGGVENHVYYLAEQLIAGGYDVTVICANEPAGKYQEVLSGVNVKRMNYSFKIANTNISFGFPWEVLRTSFDVAHAHMPTPWTADWTVLISWLKKKPVILTVHNDMDKSDLIGKIITWIYLHTFFLITLKLASKIVIVNPEWKTSFKKTNKIFLKYLTKIIVVTNGIDTNKFHPQEINSLNQNILFVSILDEHHRFKGFDYLIKAMLDVHKNVPNAKLIVVGEGKLVSEYKKEVLNFGLKDVVQFHGKKTQAELIDYYQNAKVFVLPSTEIEGFGIVLLEAMASGVPVITTDAAGVAGEISKFNTGIVVARKNSNEIASAIVTVLNDEYKRKVMGVNGRKLMEQQYSWKMVADSISNIFKEETCE